MNVVKSVSSIRSLISLMTSVPQNKILVSRQYKFVLLLAALDLSLNERKRVPFVSAESFLSSFIPQHSSEFTETLEANFFSLKYEISGTKT